MISHHTPPTSSAAAPAELDAVNAMVVTEFEPWPEPVSNAAGIVLGVAPSPGCPSPERGALMYETAGRFPVSAVCQNADRSYWWLAWSWRPISWVDDGGTCIGLAVCG